MDTSDRTNTWDSQNRLTSCSYQGTASTFTYGADGLRRSETVTPSGGSAVTTRDVYDGTMMVQEQRGTGAFATYMTGTRGPECRVDETKPAAEIGYTSGKTTFQRGPTKWYVYDGLGSVVGEVDPSGSLTSSPKYDVYGLVRSNPGSASSAMGFVGGLGHLSEASTGLIYMRARYYDPSLGRFSSEDPGYSGTNWFIYCNDNPINMVDADGKDPLAVFLAILDQIIKSVSGSPENSARLATYLIIRTKQLLHLGQTTADAGAVKLERGDGDDASGNELEGKAEQLEGGAEVEDGAVRVGEALETQEEYIQLELDLDDSGQMELPFD